MFDCLAYCKALQCAMLKYAYNKPIDNWSYDILKITHGNPLTLHKNQVDKRKNPIIANIADSWTEFLTEFYKVDSNIKRGFVYNNPQIPRSTRERELLNKQFFNQNPPLNMKKIAALKICDIAQNGVVKSAAAINQSTGLQISPAVHLRLVTAINSRFVNIKNSPGEGTPLTVYINKFKKGSSQFRKVLEKQKTRKAHYESIDSLCRLSDIAPIAETEKKKVAGQWNSTFLPRKMQAFVFKLLNNKLPTNTRLSHMAREPVDRSCFYCMLENNRPAPEETFVHVFRYCPVVQNLVTAFTAEFIPEIADKEETAKFKILLTGLETTDTTNLLPVPINVTRIVLLYSIWDLRTRKKIPAYTTFLGTAHLGMSENDNSKKDPTEDKMADKQKKSPDRGSKEQQKKSPSRGGKEKHTGKIVTKEDVGKMDKMELDEFLRDSEDSDKPPQESSKSKAKKKSKRRSPSNSSTSSNSSEDSNTTTGTVKMDDGGENSSASSSSSSDSEIDLRKELRNIQKQQEKLAKALMERAKKKKEHSDKSRPKTRSDGDGSDQASPAKQSTKEPEEIVLDDEEEELEPGEYVLPKSEAYTTIRNIRSAQFSIRNIHGGVVEVQDGGSFRNRGDSRVNLTVENSSIANETTSSASFKVGSLHCVSCAPGHPILGKGVKPVFIISDQMFPAAVPLTTHRTGRCMAIIRIEDSSLWELSTYLLHNIKMDWLPVGSVVLISCGNYLARVGLSAYAEELSEVLVRLKKSMPASCFISHAPIIPLNGSEDQSFIRSLVDLHVWLLALTASGCHREILEDTVQGNLMLINQLGSGTQHNCSLRMPLPGCLTKPESKMIWASETEEEIPTSLRKPTEAEEKELILKMIEDLNYVAGTGLSTDVSIRREIVLSHEELNADAIRMHIFVGNFVAEKLYEAAVAKNMPATLIKMADTSPREAERTATRLETVVISQSRVSSMMLVVFCLLDEEAYTSRDGEPPYRDTEGRKHLYGQVDLIGRRELTSLLEKYRDLIEAGGIAGKAILVPLPLFTVHSCCHDDNHTTNAGTAQYCEDLRTGLSQMARQMRITLNSFGIRRMRVLNTARTCMEVPPEVAWHRNPWVMRPEAFSAVLTAIISESGSIIAKRYGPPMLRPSKRRDLRSGGRHEEGGHHRYDEDDENQSSQGGRTRQCRAGYM